MMGVPKKFKKEVLKTGERGLKPYENTKCRVFITNCNIDVESYNKSEVIVGDNDSEFGRMLDKCLVTMNKGEQSRFTFYLKTEISLEVHMLDFESKGFIYQWDAKEKYDLAQYHKSQGVNLFKTSYVDASHRFAKALKILCSIPIAAVDPPESIDGIPIVDIQQMKINLYSNLASCYLKIKDTETVIDLCNKVLAFDENNVKALYKRGVAYIEEREFEKAQDSLKTLVQIEPNNKAALERLAYVNTKVQEAIARVNAMVKKMFVVK